MKKLAVFAMLLSVLCAWPVAASADNWGLGLKLGAGENDPKTMKEVYDSAVVSKELDKGYGVFGLEALYEWNLDETNKIGAKIGWDSYGENKAKFTGLGDVKENTYSFPFTVYYKKDNGVKNWSWFAGAGITFIHSKIKATIIGAEETDSKNKVFPHVVAGGEYRFNEMFALGLEARYNIAAKVKKDGDVYSDRSGFGGALTGRFYF